jgi:hypothetical protein
LSQIKTRGGGLHRFRRRISRGLTVNHFAGPAPAEPSVPGWLAYCAWARTAEALSTPVRQRNESDKTSEGTRDVRREN